MSNIEQFFKTDLNWLKTKIKTSQVKTEETLSKTQLLKVVGWRRFSEQAYKDYLTSRKEIIPEFIFKEY